MLSRRIADFLFVCVFLLTVSSHDAEAQAVDGRSPSSPQPAAGPSAKSDQESKLRLALVQSALGAANGPLGDYVQCRFTVGELFELRLSPDVVTLTAADSEQIRKAVIGTALSATQGNVVSEAVITEFVKIIGNRDFAGKTQSQAVTTILQDLEAAKSSVKFENFFVGGGTQGFINSLSKIQLPTVTPGNIQDLSQAAQLPQEQKFAKDLAAAPSDLAALSTSVADVARQQAGAFIRPPDVGCAMSILTYDETKRAYGTFVAQGYIAVQVVVRNLNPSQEFQVHDVQFATDLDPSGRHARFFSGRDKLIVRSFSVAQQSFDARNLTVHTSQTVGSILNAIIPVYGGSFGDAIGVLTGAAIPGLDKTWKDLSIAGLRE